MQDAIAALLVELIKDCTYLMCCLKRTNDQTFSCLVRKLVEVECRDKPNIYDKPNRLVNVNADGKQSRFNALMNVG